MTQIKPKTNRTIVATRCFHCCSLRLQQYRRTHSATPSRFTLPLKQLADTLASPARFDRIFALSNGVFHVKHRFFYCFSIEILPVFYCAFRLFFFASFCFVGLSGVFGQALYLFLLYLRLCGNVAFGFVGRQSSFFCGVGCLMWVGLSMSFCGGNKPMDFFCFVLQQTPSSLLHDKMSVLAELLAVVCVRLRYFYLCLCYLSLRARTQSMQNCPNPINLCAAKPTVELFVATIFQFSARLSVKNLLSYAAGSDDAL
ncbi:MAG: hypothetical protein U0M04_01350 [Christensenellales bacterium]|nr:hypothetical protein [Christensenellales bacterium]